jgi:peroxiredoxin
MKKILLSIFVIIALISCNSGTFKINGTITNAENEILYFENVGLLRIAVLDSVKLKADGHFSFKQKSPEYPDFYRLRVGKKTMDLAIDSIESVTVTADAQTPICDYAIENSPVSEQIRTLRCSAIELQKKINSANGKFDSILVDVETHKTFARRIIIENPRSLAAYYAIYQTINGAYIFSPYSKDDKKYCAAVATSFNTFMPKYLRSKNLYSLVMDAINSERNERKSQALQQIIDNEAIGYFDIELPDRSETLRKLSTFEGKVILLDFSAYQMENSIDYIFALRELYNTYHAKGFEIYQVSLDNNKFLWQQATENIPWVSVRGEDGANNQYAKAYNVQTIPTTYIISRKGEIVARENDFAKLKKLISENLK